MALWQRQHSCGMAGLGGTQLRVHKAPLALGGCLLTAGSHKAAQPPDSPNGSQR